ncbi:hypothetical protein BGW38_000071 [Lunasporangiospora selenospora]|uniref:C2H2-type domain-containing protein n=1 Tax=Lunasporangiospora selenospora TaxID=979761 RepID=A0A9P6G1Z6_9FUNG|nr:hypothetical protein BGW38_000071 [Lunasporangiospora selenospora]
MTSYANSIPTASIGQSTTCMTCSIRLPSLETQQKHHKSDWHTYNLKRKIVGLPPVTADEFAQLLSATHEQAEKDAKAEQPVCVPCGKKYLSFQAFDNHLNSKKHKQTMLAFEKQQQQQQTSKDKQPTPNSTASSTQNLLEVSPSEKVCLFCGITSLDAHTNYTHMKSTHGFFLPAFERLFDLSGMLTYLSEKLAQDLSCLWCTHSVFVRNLNPDQELQGSFVNLSSVRRHMLDKSHCKLGMEFGAEREYADFYLVKEGSGESDEDDSLDAQSDKNLPTETTDNTVDEDEDESQQRLHSVLLDSEGNWILDEKDQEGNEQIRIDPVTNELVLNNRRLSPKDAARRQRVESRTVTLTSRAQIRQQQLQDSTETTEGQASATAAEDSEILDLHHPSVRFSGKLLPSQNQLSGSNLAIQENQLKQAAVKVADAQHYESSLRERAANKLALNANYHARARTEALYGYKS